MGVNKSELPQALTALLDPEVIALLSRGARKRLVDAARKGVETEVLVGMVQRAGEAGYQDGRTSIGVFGPRQRRVFASLEKVTTSSRITAEREAAIDAARRASRQPKTKRRKKGRGW